MPVRSRTVAELLGYAADARLLIINADDFGMCHAENTATIEGLQQGAFCSASVMVPCPWFGEVVPFAQRVPTADLGVHLTHTSEWETYRWGPVAGRDTVDSLVDPHGYLHRDLESFYSHARLDQVERESRAQIDTALAAGIDVSHLDSHMGTVQLDVTYHALYVRLAAEYRLPIRMARRTWLHGLGMGHIVEQADRSGVLAPDHFWFGGPPRPEETTPYWTEQLRQLLPGVNEIYIHPAVDAPEIRAVTGDWAQRVADFRFFTAPSTRAQLRDLGITLIGYRALRDLQRSGQPC